MRPRPTPPTVLTFTPNHRSRTGGVVARWVAMTRVAKTWVANRPGLRPTWFAAGLLLTAGPATAQSRVAPSPLGSGERPMPAEVQDIAQNGVKQRIGEKLPLDTPLRDENGNAVRLSDYFGRNKPVIIEFAYLDCPCSAPWWKTASSRASRARAASPAMISPC